MVFESGVKNIQAAAYNGAGGPWCAYSTWKSKYKKDRKPKPIREFEF